MDPDSKKKELSETKHQFGIHTGVRGFIWVSPKKIFFEVFLAEQEGTPIFKRLSITVIVYNNATFM